MTVDRDGVHVTHCCLRHGCKYMNWDDLSCPVASGAKEQAYPCEYCNPEMEKMVEDLKAFQVLLPNLIKYLEEKL